MAGRGWGNQVLTFYPVFLHLLDLSDGLAQVVCELLAVLRVGSVEVDEDFEVCTWDGRCEADSIWVICRNTNTISGLSNRVKGNQR